MSSAISLAIDSMAKSYDVIDLIFRNELGKHGIRVNCVSPFMVHTPILGPAMGGAVDGDKAAGWVAASANLKGQVAETDDVAEAAVFLGSEESKYVSGLNLVVDGGYSKVNPMLNMAFRGVRL